MRAPDLWGVGLGAALRLFLALGLLAGEAAAQLGSDSVFPDPARAAISLGTSAAVVLPGSIRAIGGRVDGFGVNPIDPAVPGTTPRDDLLYLRLRAQPGVVVTDAGPFALLKLATDLELHWHAGDAGPAAGQEADRRAQFREDPVARLAQAYVSAIGRYGVAQVGLVRSHFGLGVVANGAEDAPLHSVRQSPFGYGMRGDRNLRVLGGWFPLGGGEQGPPLTVALAADAVLDDDTARWDDDDRAYQGIAGVLGRWKGLSGGVGLVWRTQSHGAGGETDVLIGVASLQASRKYGPAELWAEAELAGYRGETTFLRSPLRPGAYEILTAGGVLRGGVRSERFETALEVGFASGDDNPFDDQIRTFSFDRDYRVGLLMFSEAMRMTTAMASHNASDPRFRGEPPPGVDRLASDGVVHNAIYVNPRFGVPIRSNLSVVAGYLYGITDVPYADPFQSGLAGGDAIGPHGARRERELGHELDVGVDGELALVGLQLRARAQAAWFRPGAVFADADGGLPDDQFGVWLQTEVLW